MQAIYGEKPKELDIIFPVELWPEQWYKAYSASRGLVCKGDGKQATALVDPATGKFATAASPSVELTEIGCDTDSCGLYEKGQCHRIMNLQFIIPKVKALGVWQLDTGSVNSIININSSLDLIRGITGRISMIPMKLVVEPQEAQVEGKKKTIHVLKLVVERSFNELVELPSLPRASVLLPSSDTEAPDDLYPEGIVAQEPDETPPAVAARPGPARRRKPAGLLPAAKPEEPKADAAPAPCSRERGSVTPETNAKANHYLAAEATGLTGLKLLKSKGWETDGDTANLSEYQAQVIIAVCEGRDEKDVQ